MEKRELRGLVEHHQSRLWQLEKELAKRVCTGQVQEGMQEVPRGPGDVDLMMQRVFGPVRD